MTQAALVKNHCLAMQAQSNYAWFKSTQANMWLAGSQSTVDHLCVSLDSSGPSSRRKLWGGCGREFGRCGARAAARRLSSSCRRRHRGRCCRRYARSLLQLDTTPLRRPTRASTISEVSPASSSGQPQQAALCWCCCSRQVRCLM